MGELGIISMMSMALDRLADLLWYLSVVAGLGLLVWRAERDGLDPREAFLAGVFGVLGGMLGGSLTVSGGLPPGISANPTTWSQFVYAEKGVFGVVVGGVSLAGIWLVARGQSALRFADAAALAAALAYVIARLDCFAHGHCFGVLTGVPWAVTFVPGTQAYLAQISAGLIALGAATTLPVHPAQLYHALLGLVGFMLLLRVLNDVPGARLAMALMLYGAGRFVIEFFRGDAVPMWGPLDVNHIASLVMLVAGLLLWRWRATPAVGQEQPA
jgi:phosphatidylglycerol---prolipoprotein diacylglyceryl transferase